MTTEIILVFILILANGLFSMAEMAIVSARRTRLVQQAEDGNSGAQAALDLSQESTRFLSTVQIGITSIGILSGAVGGATLGEKLGVILATIPALAPYSEALGVVLVVLIITYLSLVLGELVPKRLALSNAERVATRLAPSMARLSRLATPLVTLLSLSTDGLVRLLGIKPSDEPPVTEEEVKMMIYEGTQFGIFEEAEQDIMKRVFRLGDRRISTLMTYRSEVVWLDVEDTLEDNLQKITLSNYSRYPVCQGEFDQVLGMVEVKDLFTRLIANPPVDLTQGLSSAMFLPEGMSGLEALAQFKQAKEQSALVVDEFGGLVGMVTLKDLLEAIVGDLPTPEETEEAEIIQRDDGTWLLDGMLPFDEVVDLLDMDRPDEEEEGNFETLGGFVMFQLGKIPISGENFEWDDYQFEVMDMDGHRVDKVMVSPRQGL